ncbi:hypothetical protein T08_8471, partial [Trichinella sp. T8]
LFTFPVTRTKIALSCNVFCNISANTLSCNVRLVNRFWKVSRQTNAYVLNKWSLTLPRAYLNTQGTAPSETPLKRMDDGMFFDIVMMYSLELSCFVQYFVVLSKSFFLHLQSCS